MAAPIDGFIYNRVSPVVLLVPFIMAVILVVRPTIAPGLPLVQKSDSIALSFVTLVQRRLRRCEDSAIVVT